MYNEVWVAKNMKKIVIVLLILVGLGVIITLWKQNNRTPVLPINQTVDATTQDMTAIRTFMGDPNSKLSFINTDLPFPVYFRVGKVTKMDGGENMEAVDGWTRKVNIYHQNDLLNEQCSVYEYHLDVRNHALVAVVISGLKPGEIEDYKEDGITCVTTNSNKMPKITKIEAETIAMDYLARGVKNFDQIKNQFTYSQGYNSESHTWIWENKEYKLPEGLEGRPYSYPTIRISVYGDKSIQYWNTVSLFEK